MKSTSYGLTCENAHFADQLRLMFWCLDISLGIGFLLACILLATVGSESLCPPKSTETLPLTAHDAADRSYLKAAKAAAERGEKTPPEARLTLAYPGAILAPM